MNRKGLNVTLFQTSRNFYGLYPQMGGLFVPNEIYSTLSNKLGTDSSFISELADSKTNAICATASHKFTNITRNDCFHAFLFLIYERL